MAYDKFTPTKENFDILRNRINEFLEQETFWGAGNLLKASNSHAKFLQDPSSYRTALNKFLSKNQKTINTDVAKSLWSYMINFHPNETLNKEGANINVEDHKISYDLRQFFDVDREKALNIYAPNLSGHYIMIRQAWNLEAYVAIGRIQITVAPETQGHVIEVEEWVSGRRKISNQIVKEPDPELEHSKGYAFPKGPNIFMLLKTDGSQLKIITVENVVPEPPRKSPFRILKGSIYAAIGQGPHWAKRFIAHRIDPERNFEICTKKIDSDIVEEFGHHEDWWLSEVK